MLAALLVVGCGAPRPPTLVTLRDTLDTTPDKTPAQWARLGWLRYLEGNSQGASQAFTQAPDQRLSALGRARISQDRLDAKDTLADAALAARTPGLVGRVARLWAENAAAEIRDGDTLLTSALGDAAGARQVIRPTGTTPVISFLPHLDWVQLRDHPPTPMGDDRVHALGREWSLLASERPKGGHLFLSRWELPDGPVHIEIAGADNVMAWRGGDLVAATPRTRFSTQRVRFSVDGAGPLIVAWTGKKQPSLWRWKAPAPPRQRVQDPIQAFLMVEYALLDGDTEWASRALAHLPLTAAFDVQRAEAIRRSPGLPASLQRDEAHAIWLRTMAAFPARSALALANIEQRQGAYGVAEKRLAALAVSTPTSAAVHRAWARALAAQGANDKALSTLETAARHGRDPCVLLDERIQLVGSSSRRARSTLITDLLQCGRYADAAAQHLERDRPQMAAELLAKADPSPAIERLWAKVDIALGAIDAGRARLTHLAADATPEDRLLASDLLLAEGDAARAKIIGDYIKSAPTARQALRLAATHPEWSPFATLRLDSDEAIAAYEAAEPMKGAAVRVLDHSALLFLGSDESLRWVHEILAINSRDAAENFGELGLPADARPVAVFTRKADGRRLYAEDSPEKETLSLPDLAVGDYVVAVYLEPGDNGYLYDTGMVSPRVFFRGVDLPIFHQRFEVFAPDAAPLVVETKNHAPTAENIRLDGRAGWRFEARSVPLKDAEPRSVPPSHWLPWVRVGRGLDFFESLRFLRNQHGVTRRWTDRFTTWVRKHWQGDDLMTRLGGLTHAVREAVDGSDGIAGTDATRAVESGVGNRAAVTSVALELLGVPHRLVLARPRVHDSGGVFSQPTDFVYPLIQVQDGPWIDPGQPGARPGFLPFVFLSGQAVVIWPTDAVETPIDLPKTRPSGDGRTIEIEAHWNADGVVTGRVRDRLWGQEAIVIGRYLARLDAETQPRLVERLFAGVLGGARVDDLHVEHSAGQLTLEYAFEAQGGEAMTVGLAPVRPGQRFASLADRTLPLYVDLPTAQTVRFQLTSARDFETDGRSTRHVHEDDAFAFSREVDADDDRLEVESTLHIAGGVIEPDRYVPFAEWARRVDAAEQLRLTRIP